MVNALPTPLLLVVADLAYVGDEARWLIALREASAAGSGRPVAVQVRAKGLASDEWRRLAGLAREAIAGVPAFLNGDADTATALGYEGLHWPEAAVPKVTSVFTGWRSAAVHSVQAIRVAERAGADVVVFGSVYEPGSKAGQAAGIGALREAVDASALPVIAIGGITRERVADCLAAGARGVGVVSGVLGAASPGAAVERYLEAMQEDARALRGAEKGGFR